MEEEEEGGEDEDECEQDCPSREEVGGWTRAQEEEEGLRLLLGVLEIARVVDHKVGPLSLLLCKPQDPTISDPSPRTWARTRHTTTHDTTTHTTTHTAHTTHNTERHLGLDLLSGFFLIDVVSLHEALELDIVRRIHHHDAARQTVQA